MVLLASVVVTEVPLELNVSGIANIVKLVYDIKSAEYFLIYLFSKHTKRFPSKSFPVVLIFDLF